MSIGVRVLVTGGTGVVGVAAIDALLAHGHAVRLLSRNASRDAERWRGVEARDASVGDRTQLTGSADDCDAVLHVAGIVAETPPDVTFERVNVEGTRNMVEEAARARVPRFVYVSSLGAGRGSSEYHKSKVSAEKIVEKFGGDWVICRIGNVYGTGDEVISVLLRWMRASPVMPVLGSGNDPFQPIWAEDAGAALAQCVERSDLNGRILDLAGPETTSINDVLERLGAIIGRQPVRVPIPTPLVSLGAMLAGKAGVELPVNESHLAMLREHSVIDPGKANALDEVLGIAPTRLDEGLKRLADSLPEQLPENGVGETTNRRYWADIAGSKLTAEGLFARFRLRFAELTPWSMDVGAEEGTPKTLTDGATVTMALPFRGNIQVRVVEVSDLALTLVTVAGHPLSGAVRFSAAASGATIRFQADAYDRASSVGDWLAMSTVGRPLQESAWHGLIENVIRESGGGAPDGVHQETRVLSEEAARETAAWVNELVAAHRRGGKSRSRPADPAPRAG